MTQCFSRLLAIMAKEVRQLRRDRLTFGMIVGIPLLQIMLFGYAINTDVRHLSAAVVDQAGSQLSRTTLADVAASQVVNLVATAHTPAERAEFIEHLDTLGYAYWPESDNPAYRANWTRLMICGGARSMSPAQ